MAKLRHIALSVPDPEKAVRFCERAFGMTRVGETDSALAAGVYLSGGVINVGLLEYESDGVAARPRALRR